MRDYPAGKMGRREAVPTARELRSVVRRMGYVITKFHETAMAALTAAGMVRLAEEFNDTVKPVADYCNHFELEDDDDETTP